MNTPLHELKALGQSIWYGGDAGTWVERAAAHGVELGSLGEALQTDGDASFAEALDRPRARGPRPARRPVRLEDLRKATE